jgi:hypothetical protein
LQPSPGNHQAWVAVSDLVNAEDTKDLSRRLRKRAGADPSASGATRIAGTVNYKRKYEPHFPTVAIVNASPGRVMTTSELDAQGLVAPPEPELSSPVVPLRPRRAHGPHAREHQWLEYERTLAGAPPI